MTLHVETAPADGYAFWLPSKVALLFPGQGAQSPAMFEGVRHLAEFRHRYEIICEYTGTDVIRGIDSGDDELLNQNTVSSLMTVLVSSLSLDIFKCGEGAQPGFLAGYSVGQWSAMYAASMVTFEVLVAILVERSRLMNECVAREPSAMCAIIGVKENALESLLKQLRADGHKVFISNYNCSGQYSIAGTLSAIRLAEEQMQLLRPKKLLRLAVSGAWHCPILTDAEVEFGKYLEGIEFRAPDCPIVDNVTGEWLPTNDAQLRVTLARHISHPVYWEHGIKSLIARGCNECIEMGYGKHLAKFGFFIDRDITWRSFCF